MFPVQTQLCLIRRAPGTLSSSTALRLAGPLSFPRPLHQLLPEITFPCYLDTWYILSILVFLRKAVPDYL